ncbi:hypothetical protein HAX54_006666, partial [Datura stramonium]|nr:hypothetical protein [Datura stramonium]
MGAKSDFSINFQELSNNHPEDSDQTFEVRKRWSQITIGKIRTDRDQKASKSASNCSANMTK